MARNVLVTLIREEPKKSQGIALAGSGEHNFISGK
jgi:hypothetical protein